MQFKKKIDALKKLRDQLKKNKPSVGSWLQIANTSVAEILSNSNYDWLAIDLEHGDITENDIPNLCNSIHSKCPLVFARVRSSNPTFCSRALDLGVQGLIIPKIESGEQLLNVSEAISYPPLGTRGVGFCKANIYGIDLQDHLRMFQDPFLVAMIETVKGLNNIEEILQVPNLDAIFIGPYDLSASLDLPGDIFNKIVLQSINKIKESCKRFNIPCGIHVVTPDEKKLRESIEDGFLFLAYGMDSVFISNSSINPFGEDF